MLEILFDTVIKMCDVIRDFIVFLASWECTVFKTFKPIV